MGHGIDSWRVAARSPRHRSAASQRTAGESRLIVHCRTAPAHSRPASGAVVTLDSIYTTSTRVSCRAPQPDPLEMTTRSLPLAEVGTERRIACAAQASTCCGRTSRYGRRHACPTEARIPSWATGCETRRPSKSRRNRAFSTSSSERSSRPSSSDGRSVITVEVSSTDSLTDSVSAGPRPCTERSLRTGGLARRQRRHEPGDLRPVGVPGPGRQRLPSQPAPVPGKHTIDVHRLASRRRLLAGCSHRHFPLDEAASQCYGPLQRHVSRSARADRFH